MLAEHARTARAHTQLLPVLGDATKGPAQYTKYCARPKRVTQEEVDASAQADRRPAA